MVCNLRGDKKNPDRFPKNKGFFSLGVTSLALLENGRLLVGAGDGTVAEMSHPGNNGDYMKKVK